MKIIRFNDLDFIPASHEDPKDPGVLKKVLLTKDHLPPGTIQMINWSKLPKGKSFKPHYHEAMIEVFIVISGRIRAKVDGEEAILEKGDLVLVKEKQAHIFENISEEDVDYLCIGVVTSEGGRSINI